MTQAVGSSTVAALDEAFERAASARGRIERAFAIAGAHVRVAFAGEALEQGLWPALAHLEQPSPGDAAPALTIKVLDQATSGVPTPGLGWTDHPDVTSPNAQVLLKAGSVRGWCEAGTGQVQVLDSERGVAFAAYRDARALTFFERAAPVRMILDAWVRRRGLHVVHAAAVGTEHGGVLIPARSGSGKSTTSLACVEAGFEFVGDDYVVLEHATWGVPLVHSLYATAKLWPENSRKMLPGLAPGSPPGPGEKAVYLLHERHRGRLPSSLPLRALLLPAITGGAATRIRPASPATALRVAAPSSVLIGEGHPEALAVLAALVRALPSYVLELGTDLGGVTDAIRRFLAELATKGVR